MTNQITILELSKRIAETGDLALSVEDVADALGLKVASLRVYAARSTKSRLQGVQSRKQLPLPDFTFGRSPIWLKSTLVEWRGDLVKIQ